MCTFSSRQPVCLRQAHMHWVSGDSEPRHLGTTNVKCSSQCECLGRVSDEWNTGVPVRHCSKSTITTQPSGWKEKSGQQWSAITPPVTPEKTCVKQLLIGRSTWPQDCSNTIDFHISYSCRWFYFIALSHKRKYANANGSIWRLLFLYMTNTQSYTLNDKLERYLLLILPFAHTPTHKWRTDGQHGQPSIFIVKVLFEKLWKTYSYPLLIEW